MIARASLRRTFIRSPGFLVAPTDPGRLDEAFENFGSAEAVAYSRKFRMTLRRGSMPKNRTDGGHRRRLKGSSLAAPKGDATPTKACEPEERHRAPTRENG